MDFGAGWQWISPSREHFEVACGQNASSHPDSCVCVHWRCLSYRICCHRYRRLLKLNKQPRQASYREEKKIAYEASHTIDEFYIWLRSGGKHKFTSTSVFNILILSGFMLNLLVSSSTIHTHTQRTHRARHTASVSTTVGIYMHARYDVVFGPSMENGKIPAQKYKIKWSKVIDMW